MSLYAVKNNSLGIDMACGEWSYSSALFGVVEVEIAGDLSVISILGLSVFEQDGDISALFGVSWL